MSGDAPDEAIAAGKVGWDLLTAPLPKAALTPLSDRIYNVKNLTDVNEGYLWQRLYHSGFQFSWKITQVQYLGQVEVKKSDGSGTYMQHTALVSGDLIIQDSSKPGGEPQTFSGAATSENRRQDAAVKGAATSAFKQACKWAGLTMQLYKGGQIMDQLFEVDGKVVNTGAETTSEPVTAGVFAGSINQMAADRGVADPPPAAPAPSEATGATPAPSSETVPASPTFDAPSAATSVELTEARLKILNDLADLLPPAAMFNRIKVKALLGKPGETPQTVLQALEAAHAKQEPGTAICGHVEAARASWNA